MSKNQNTRRRTDEAKEALREDILITAKKMFIQQGYESVSIRKIAGKLAISPTTIYLYYKDKTSMIYALHQEGFKLLANYFYKLKEIIIPFERLKAMGLAYIQFAIVNPDFYELMFLRKEPLDYVQRNEQSEWSEGTATFKDLEETVNACRADGYFGSMDTCAMAIYLWSTIHGLCSLKLKGHLDYAIQANYADKKVNFSINQAFETLVDMIAQTKHT